MYKLVYIEHKKVYWLSLITAIVSLCLLAIYTFLIISHIDLFLERLCSISCLLTSLCSLALLKYIEKNTKEKHLKIQNIRYKLLKKYYKDNNYNNKDIKIINQQLEKRIQKIEKQKITVLLIISVVVLPIWEIFVQSYFDEFSTIKAIRFLFLSIIVSFIVLFIARAFTKTLYLYEENIYIKNNIALIKNLIYLNGYIIQKKEDTNNNGRRK